MNMPPAPSCLRVVAILPLDLRRLPAPMALRACFMPGTTRAAFVIRSRVHHFSSTGKLWSGECQWPNNKVAESKLIVTKPFWSHLRASAYSLSYWFKPPVICAGWPGLHNPERADAELQPRASPS